ncbi:MAG: DUF805 domain-containing protein [Pseudomonadota bacterium]
MSEPSISPPAPGIVWALLSFRGRMGRRAFFLGSLLPIIGFATSVAAVLSETNPLTNEVETTSGLVFAFLLLGILFSAPWVYAALVVKRLKDLNLAWPLMFLALIPLVALPAFAFLCLVDGTPGPNPNGPRRNSRPWDE